MSTSSTPSTKSTVAAALGTPLAVLANGIQFVPNKNVWPTVEILGKSRFAIVVYVVLVLWVVFGFFNSNDHNDHNDLNKCLDWDVPLPFKKPTPPD